MLSTKNYNRLMLVGVYCTFIEPLKGLFMLPLPGFYANLQELGLVLFAFGYFNSGRDASVGTYRALSRLSMLLLGVIAVVEFFKLVQYGGGPAAVIRVNRINMNGLCALMFFALGLRPGARLLVHHVFCAILISSSVALVFGILGIKPTSLFVSLGEAMAEKREWLEATGRFGGLHSNLGVAMVLLIYFYGQNMRAFVIPRVWRWVILASALVTIVIAITSFNRTLMGAMLLALPIVLFLEFRIRAFFAAVVVSVLVVATGWIAIANNKNVEKQFRDRIVVAFEGREALLESIYYGGRENIYSEVGKRIKEYPILGLPYGVPAFVSYDGYAVASHFNTDISFLNVYLRYGILAGPLMMLVVFFLFWVAYAGRRFFPPGELNMYARMLFYAVPVYVLISLNYDVYLRHSAIVFFAMMAMHISYYRETVGQNRHVRQM